MAESGKQSKQISCYVTEEWHSRARAAANKRGIRHVSDWFRGLVMNAIVETEAEEVAEVGDAELPPEVELAAARKSIEGLEALLNSQRERFNDQQVHLMDLKSENDRLYSLLEQEQANVERITYMLPAAGETSKPTRWWSVLWNGIRPGEQASSTSGGDSREAAADLNGRNRPTG